MSDTTHVVDRRTVLATGGASALASLAGCAAVPGIRADPGPTYPTLTAVYLTNEHREPHRFHVRVERGEEVVHRDSYDVEAYDPAENAAGQVVVEPPAFASEPADWRVATRVDRRDAGVAMRLKADAAPGGCYPVEFELTEGAELVASYGVTAECGPEGATTGR